MTEIKKILLVDDDADDQEIFTLALYEVDPEISCIMAERGEDALGKLKTFTILPDLIFLDLNMPGMNGLEVLEILKNDPKLKKIPVIIYSTMSRHRIGLEARSLGASLVLTKPARFSELSDLLRSVISQYSPGKETQTAQKKERAV